MKIKTCNNRGSFFFIISPVTDVVNWRVARQHHIFRCDPTSWLLAAPRAAVRLTDRFLDGRGAYYTPCRIPSRSCESVRYGVLCSSDLPSCFCCVSNSTCFKHYEAEVKSNWDLLDANCIQSGMCAVFFGDAHQSFVTLNTFTYELLVVLANFGGFLIQNSWLTWS